MRVRTLHAAEGVRRKALRFSALRYYDTGTETESERKANGKRRKAGHTHFYALAHGRKSSNDLPTMRFSISEKCLSKLNTA